MSRVRMLERVKSQERRVKMKYKKLGSNYSPPVFFVCYGKIKLVVSWGTVFGNVQSFSFFGFVNADTDDDFD